MGFPSGKKLGPYEIVTPLGAGGMGEVYRARDTRLDRTVAVKILPPQFASDSVRRQRFEREAKVVSSLNHPNICTLHDIGHQDGIDYLVMECVEGETLARRLERGPLPLDQVLKYGTQIADALDKAHRSGVVHRDLKPGNIMLAPTGAKLLDFGLAKPATPLSSGDALTAAQPTPVTEEGTIVGTFQYMSPEQVEGKELDGRSDIFSLGTVLYEMITGKTAFAGKSRLSVASLILEKEPDPLSASKPMVPPVLDHVVKKCLAKHPDERWQSASDLASELKWISESASQTAAAARRPAARKLWERASRPLTAALLLFAVISAVAWWQAAGKRPRPMYFHASVPFAANDMALSPDGRTLAMVAYSLQTNNYVLWTYEVGGRRTTALEGTQGASYPFWSPDNKFIGFFADGKLKKVDVSSGQVWVLCDAPNGRGGSWNRDGVVIFTPNSLGGLFRVSSSGGSPVELTKPDASRLETSHRWPVFLPDEKHFLYLGANFSGQLDKNAIFVGSLDSKERRLLVSTSANAAYADPGYLVYLQDNKTLVAQPFDRRSYVLSSEPRALSDEVLYLPLVDRAVFTVSSGDILVTQTGKGAAHSQLTWFDRSGKPVGSVGPPGSYNNIRLSPDGRKVAADQTDPDGQKIDIWIHDLAEGGAARLTFGLWLPQAPIWSPDGKQIIFDVNHTLGMRIYVKNADGSGSEEEVATLGGASSGNAWDWSSDGSRILFRKQNELWTLSWPEREAKPLFQAPWTVRNAQFSPDGKWIAYSSNETGALEIYVSPFPNANGKWQVSTAGGQEPRWRHDGKELFYVAADGKMMAVAVNAGTSFKSGTPAPLFQTHRRQPYSSQDHFSYDVTADGQKFLVITKMEEASAPPLSVLLNWSSEVGK